MPQSPYQLRDAIAVRDLKARDPLGSAFDLLLMIGRPRQVGEADWACDVVLHPLQANLQAQHGVDSFQALMLAQRLARVLLEDFVKSGGRLLHAEDGHEVSVSNLFESGAG